MESANANILIEVDAYDFSELKHNITVKGTPMGFRDNLVGVWSVYTSGWIFGADHRVLLS